MLFHQISNRIFYTLKLKSFLIDCIALFQNFNSIKLYVSAYNLESLLKIVALAYKNDSRRFCKKEKKRKELNPTQEAFTEGTGVVLTVIQKTEQEKENLNLKKIDQVLNNYQHTLAPVYARELAINN